MKFKTTRKELQNKAAGLRCAGYCDLQYLLRGVDPVAYAAGVYGWNFDVYMVHGLTICTGYRGMPGARLKGIDEYETKARKLWDWDTPGTYEEKEEQARQLLKEFCDLNKKV